MILDFFSFVPRFDAKTIVGNVVLSAKKTQSLAFKVITSAIVNHLNRHFEFHSLKL